MRPNQVVESIARTPPAEVPEALFESLPFILGQYQATFDALMQGPVTPALYVARTWMWALATTNGAFWEPPSQPRTITPFGAAILSWVSLQTIGEISPAAREGWVTPTVEECQTLAAVIMVQSAKEDEGGFAASVRAWVARAAIALTPSTFVNARRQLGVAAIKTVNCFDIPIKHSSGEERLRLQDAKIALHEAASRCFPAGSQQWALGLVSWAGELDNRYDLTGDPADLDAAIHYFHKGASALPENTLDGAAARMMYERTLSRRRGRPR